jgi:hypothetical protein
MHHLTFFRRLVAGAQAHLAAAKQWLESALDSARGSGARCRELHALAELANLHEHHTLTDDMRGDRQQAACYRQQLFFLLSTRFAQPTPRACPLSGASMQVLSATPCSHQVTDEVTVVPTCLHTFRTVPLRNWQQAPPPRSSWLSSDKWSSLRPPPPCPLCAQ